MNVRIFCVVISLLACMLALSVSAQYENVWAFGDSAGIDFNGNTPQAIKTHINTSEGSASICDAGGQLCFYTDGTDVWDRNNNLMPNGSDLPGIGTNITASTTQGALIVPMPGSQEKYYIFSLGQFNTQISNSPYLGRLYYSIVDMTLNGGLGAVVSGHKGILLDSMLTEHLTAVSGNHCNIWLVVASQTAGIFKAYTIDFNGIDPNPVRSPKVPGEGQYLGILGSIDIAPDRSRLAIAQGNLILYDFDPQSGAITNPFTIDESSRDYYYGVCFSPNGTKLYGSTGFPFVQFDLSSGDTTMMLASKTTIAHCYYTAIKRGPDGKVYFADYRNNALNVINEPDLAGAACQYTYRGFSLLRGTASQLGLPNAATIVTKRKVIQSGTDTVFCASNLKHIIMEKIGRLYAYTYKIQKK